MREEAIVRVLDELVRITRAEASEQPLSREDLADLIEGLALLIKSEMEEDPT